MIREALTLKQLQELPADEAAALLTIRLAEGGTSNERELFAEWLGLMPSHRLAWERAQATWKVFDREDENEVLQAIRDHARSAVSSAQPRSTWRLYAVAASLCVMVATGAMVAHLGDLFERPAARTGNLEARSSSNTVEYVYATGREFPKSVVLPDGSKVTLDAGSRVVARFGHASRQVQLQSGRAYFAVVHDATRPFVVHAMDLDVTDVGTRFDVEMRPRDVRIVLMEGRVSVATASSAAPIIVSEGQQLVAGGSAPPQLTKGVPGDADWQRGLATFHDDTLAEAAAVLNRYPGDRLVVSSPQVRQMRISGTFKIGDSMRFGRALEQIYPVRVVRKAGGDVEILPAT